MKRDTALEKIENGRTSIILAMSARTLIKSISGLKPIVVEDDNVISIQIKLDPNYSLYQIRASYLDAGNYLYGVYHGLVIGHSLEYEHKINLKEV